MPNAASSDLSLSSSLSSILGVSPTENMSQPQVVKRLWTYLKEKQLEEEEGSPHTELQVEDRGVRYLAHVIVVPGGQLRKYSCFSLNIIMIKY